MLRFRLLAVLVVAILMSSITWAATYYVDNVYGKDTNNGTSTTTPWKTIAKVNSVYFRPGDQILFKRGVIWKETLTPKQDGTSSYPITFGSYGSGTLPLIDGSSSRQHGIYVSGRAYVIIKEFKIQNTVHGAIRVIRSKYVTVKNSEMYVNCRAGVFIEESSYCLIANNKMTTPATDFNVQTDGIYAQRNANNIYEGNNIVISNKNLDQHCDGIQFYLETSATVKNNYVEQNNTKTNHAQGIYCSENSGVFRIYNNISVGMYTKSSVFKFKSVSSTGRAEVIGNTFYGGQMALVQTNDPYIIFKNNIVMTTSGNAVINFERTVSNKANINYNLYKRSTSGSTVIVQSGSSYTMSSWRSSGYDTYGIEGDPKFSSVSSRDFTLQSVSPALNKGINLSSPYNMDRVGTARPYGIKSDIGAFEMKIAAKEDALASETETVEEITPGSFELEQNYPNPFNPSTTIKFTLPENSMVTLKVYDITGSEVAVLINDIQNAGAHTVQFDASHLASGTYIYMLTAKDFVQTKKMILLK